MFLSELMASALKLCKRARHEIINSKFIPTYFEKRIEDDQFKIGDMKIVGFVDRVDVYEDNFRVIDYKTGAISSNILSSLYYGQKLQLFLYGAALKNSLGLDFSGAFYFDAKVSYSKNQRTILRGIYKPTQKIIFAMDKRLEDEDVKSGDIISATKTEKGFGKATMSQPRLSKLQDYSIKVASKAIEHMKAGNIKPCPSSQSCTYCAYRASCLFENDCGFREKKTADKIFKEEESDVQTD